jgi:hypothetical protein
MTLTRGDASLGAAPLMSVARSRAAALSSPPPPGAAVSVMQQAAPVPRLVRCVAQKGEEGGSRDGRAPLADVTHALAPGACVPAPAWPPRRRLGCGARLRWHLRAPHHAPPPRVYRVGARAASVCYARSAAARRMRTEPHTALLCDLRGGGRSATHRLRPGSQRVGGSAVRRASAQQSARLARSRTAFVTFCDVP